MRILIKFLVISCFFLLSACAEKHDYYQGYIEGEYTQIASSVSGVLISLNVMRGDSVKQGQLLFALDPEPETSQLREAQNHLAQAQSNLDNLMQGARKTIIEGLMAQKEQAAAALDLSKINLQRSQELYSKAAIGKAVLDQAQSTYLRDLNKVNEVDANLQEAKLGARQFLIRAQQASVQAAEATVKQMTWRLSQKTLYAPVTSRVFDTYYRPGEFVAAQHPVLSLLATKNIKLVFFIPERRRAQLEISQMIYFTCDGCKNRYTAKIYYVSPQAEYTPPIIYSRDSDSKLVYRVEAKLDLEDAEQLHPGQPVEVYLK